MSKTCKLILSLAFTVLMLGCSKSTLEKKDRDRTVTIAVVLSQDSYDHWLRIMQLAQKNISDATDICPVFKFYDEDSHDIMRLAYDLARDESIHCVIGCENNENTETLAYQMSRLKKQKPMFTFSTSQDVIRKYSTKGFMWGLSESDITQSEVILAQIAQDASNSEVALIANNGSSGQTFVDWFAFQASELGLIPRDVRRYDDISEIAPILEELSKLQCPIVCVPNSPREAAEMIMNTRSGYFSNAAFNAETLEILKSIPGTEDLDMRGITLVPDPHSGFYDIYTAKYGGDTPIFGEAQLYDAIMVTSLAYAVAEEFKISLNKAISELLATNGRHLGGWTRDAIQWNFSQIVDGHTIPFVSGAVGDLEFAPNKHTIINKSTYAVQYLSHYKFHQTDYISRDGTGASSSIHSAWVWNKVYDQEFDLNQKDSNLPSLTGKKAVLIASSMGWDNYRHQADILAYYQLLKENNFTDDDIILIMADDLAFNENNPYPGIIARDETSQVNLYAEVQVDYTLEQLSPNDLKNIMLGNRTEELPTVLNSGNQDNVLFIWSGHGAPDVLHWKENRQTITGRYLQDLFSEMYSRGRYRKFWGVIEACYSGSVAMQCVGIPNLLLMTAANDKETSKAQLYSTAWGTFLTNSFTSSLLDALESDPYYTMSINELYTKTFSMTMGSHVTLYNVENFGNVHFNNVRDYFLNGIVIDF